MDLEDIDTWYQSQKEKLTDKYRKDLQLLQDSYDPIPVDEKHSEESEKKIELHQQKIRKKADKLREQYENSLKKLHEKYEKKSESQIQKNLKQHNRKHRLDMIKRKLFGPYYSWKEQRTGKKKQK